MDGVGQRRWLADRQGRRAWLIQIADSSEACQRPVTECTMPNLAQKIDQIAKEFSELEPRERLELLLEYAENLPDLPPRYHAERDAGEHRVPECQTPVFIWLENVDERVTLIAYVAPEAPTVKGFVGILAEAFADASIEEALAVDANLVSRFGLAEALGMMRMRGLQGILFYIRKQISRAAANAK